MHTSARPSGGANPMRPSTLFRTWPMLMPEASASEGCVNRPKLPLLPRTRRPMQAEAVSSDCSSLRAMSEFSLARLTRPELAELSPYLPELGDYRVRLDANEAPPLMSDAAKR